METASLPVRSSLWRYVLVASTGGLVDFLFFAVFARWLGYHYLPVGAVGFEGQAHPAGGAAIFLRQAGLGGVGEGALGAT